MKMFDNCHYKIFRYLEKFLFRFKDIKRWEKVVQVEKKVRKIIFENVQIEMVSS